MTTIVFHAMEAYQHHNGLNFKMCFSKAHIITIMTPHIITIMTPINFHAITLKEQVNEKLKRMEKSLCWLRSIIMKPDDIGKRKLPRGHEGTISNQAQKGTHYLWLT